MNPQCCLDGPMGPLQEAIGLWVIGTSRSRVDPEVGAQGTEQAGDKLSAPIRNHLAWDAEPRNPLSAESPGHAGTADVAERVGFYPAG